MTAQTVSAAEDRCELCELPSDGTAAGRMRHLRREHPAYARGVLLRLAAPIVFLPQVLLLGVVHAPPWAFLAAFLCCFALLFAGKQMSRGARRRSGIRPAPPMRALLRDGGLGIVAFVPVVVAIVVVASR